MILSNQIQDIVTDVAELASLYLYPKSFAYVIWQGKMQSRHNKIPL